MKELSPFQIQILALSALTQVQDPRKLKELIKDNFAAIYKNSDTQTFMERASVQDLAKHLSKKEQHLLKNICTRHASLNDTLIQLLADNIREFGEDSDHKKIFKDISQCLYLMQAKPYNDKSLQLAAVKKIIAWNNSNKHENIRMLHRGLNFYIDNNTLKDFLCNNPINEHKAANYISLIEKADQNQKNHCTLLNGIVGISVIATLAANQHTIVEQLNSFSSKISDYAPSIMHKVMPIISQNHEYFMLAGFAVIGVMAYNKIATGADAFVEAIRKDQIRFTTPDSINQQAFQSLCGERILGKTIHLDNFDTQNQGNRKYIALNVFLNEKLNLPESKMPQKMIDDFKFSEKEVEKINNLTADDIHELSLIKVPQIRYHIASNPNISNDTKSILKQISALSEGMDIQYDKKFVFSSLGNFIKQEDENALEFSKKIEKLSYLNQIILTSILEVLDNHNKKSCKIFIKDFFNFMDHMKNKKIDEINNQFQTFITNSISTLKEEETAKAIQNPKIHYAKRIFNMIIGKEKISHANVNIKEAIVEISEQYELQNAKYINNFHPTFIGRIKITHDAVLSKMQEIRDATSVVSKRMFKAL